jgi:hypothetical protein
MTTDRRKYSNTLAIGIALIATITSAGCGKSSDSTAPGGGGGGGTTSTFVGTMAGPTTGGKLTLVLPTTTPGPADGEPITNATITATGTFEPHGGAAVALGGTYDPATKALSVTGGGYTFTGTYFSGVLRGSWTRSPATAAGTFVLVLAVSASSVHVYCGTFTSTSGGVGGVFNFAIQGSTIDGIAYTSDGTEIRLQGTLGGASITLVNPLNRAVPGHGTINATNSTVMERTTTVRNSGTGRGWAASSHSRDADSAYDLGVS